MPSRLLSDLTPSLEAKARKFLILCHEKGLPVHVTCTARILLEQTALYAQGRQPLDEVNELRKKCGLWSLKESENQRPVTWTLDSLHIVNLGDDKLWNDKARAFDVAFVKNKQFVWELKVDVNENDLNDWEEIGRIGESVGLEWGGRFKDKDGKPRPDRPHFQEPTSA